MSCHIYFLEDLKALSNMSRFEFALSWCYFYHVFPIRKLDNRMGSCCKLGVVQTANDPQLMTIIILSTIVEHAQFFSTERSSNCADDLGKALL